MLTGTGIPLPFSACGDAFGQAVGDGAFAQRGPVLDTIGGDQMHGIVIAAEGLAARRHIVGDDPVAIFGDALGLGVLDQVRGLRGEADHQARPLRARLGQGREDVGIGGQLHRRWFRALLDLAGLKAGLATPQSATAAAQTTISTGSAACAAFSIWAAVSTCTMVTPSGVGSLVGPEISVTSAPNSDQARRQSRGPVCPTSGWRYSAPDRWAHGWARW